MTNESAPVEQRDRDAAADIWRDYIARTGEIIVERNMRAGGLDDGLPALLAKHRTACTPTAVDGDMVDISSIRSAWASAEEAAEREREGPSAGEDSAYAIGVRDGYQAAVQQLDILTGGDGEYSASTIPGRGCPTPVEMAARIIGRTIATQSIRAKALEDAARVAEQLRCGCDDDYCDKKEQADAIVASLRSLAGEQP